ncbi:unnamed protein product [Phytomonas sp. EM1]|nr:unnamed protein product [Phytomonas sp. EM1]|eukprot:CCW61989.1 unnamed protein product [Phytomonas sp. isolate EM1]
MSLSVTEAFNKHQVVRADGESALPRSRIPIAGLEAGYNLPSPVINDAASHSKYSGQLTSEEFLAFCEANEGYHISPQDMAKSVVIVAPSNVITRASLEKILSEARPSDNALSEKEVDELFNILDTEHKGAFTADHFMQSLYGDEGSIYLAEQRADDVIKAQMLKKREAEEKAAREREEQARRERERTARNAAAAAPKPIVKKKAKACC